LRGPRELPDLGMEALAAGRRLPGEIEVFLEHSTTTSIKVFRGEPESVAAAEPRGAGVRYLWEGRQGYAYTSDLSPEGLRQAVVAAADNAAATDPDPDHRLPQAQAGYSPVPGLFRSGVGATPLDRKIALALEAEKLTLALPDVRMVEEAAYGDGERRVAVVSSRGISAYAEQTFAYLYVSAHAEREGQMESGLGFMGGREPADLAPGPVAEEAASRARRLLGAGPCPSGGYRVVLDRQIVAALLGMLAAAFQADAVQKGRSLFAGREGEAVASPLLELRDDGLHPAGLATFPFDDEGVARGGPTYLLKDGILGGFLYDSRTAGKAGRASTSNSSRPSYRSAPAVGASNLLLSDGAGTMEEVLRRVGEGLYVTEVSGLHSGINPVSGEVSVGIKGQLIHGGAPSRAVREATLATDLLSLLRSVTEVAGDAQWDYLHGSVFAPSLVLAEIAVSGV